MKSAQAPAKLGSLALAIATTLVLWASAFAGIRAGLAGYEPQHLVLLRFLTASLMLLVLAPFMGVRLPDRKDLRQLALLGFTGITAYNLALSYGETNVSAGAASLLINTGPIFTAILAALLLTEPLTRWGWMGLLVSFSGAGVIAFGSGDTLTLNPWALLVLLAAALQATSFIIQKPLAPLYKPFEITCYAIWTGTLFSLVALPGLSEAVRTAPLDATLAVIYLGICPAALAYVSWAYVLLRLPAGQASSFLYIVPILAFVIAWIWLGEVPEVLTLVGGCLALGGVVIINTLGRRVA